MHVFETRTATGSERFSLLTCLHTFAFALPSIFCPLEMLGIKIWKTPLFWRAKCPLPVGVRLSKTCMLKLPNRREKLIIYSKSLTNMLTLSLNAILPKAYVVNFVMLFGWKQGIWAPAMLTLSLYAIVVVDGAFACYRPSVTVCFSFPEFKTLSPLTMKSVLAVAMLLSAVVLAGVHFSHQPFVHKWYFH